MASHNSSNANRLAGRPSDDYARSDTDDVLAGVREIRGVGLSAGIKCYNPNGDRNYHVIQKDDGRMYITDETAATVLLGMDKDRIDFRNNELWHAGNDGEGSGLDADTLRGKVPSDLGTTAVLPNPGQAWYNDDRVQQTNNYSTNSDDSWTDTGDNVTVDVTDLPYLKIKLECDDGSTGSMYNKGLRLVDDDTGTVIASIWEYEYGVISGTTRTTDVRTWTGTRTFSVEATEGMDHTVTGTIDIDAPMTGGDVN